MSRRARWRIVKDTAHSLVIKDVGPWDERLSVTNDAENVVADLAPTLRGRRLFYYDSENFFDELVVENGRFSHFKHAEEGDAK